MSGYPYDNKISSYEQINGKSVFSSDGSAIGNVEVVLGDSFIVRTLVENNNTEIKNAILTDLISKTWQLICCNGFECMSE